MTNTNTSQKLAYKLSATGLFAIFAMMVIPGSVFGGAAAADSTETGQISVYGMLDLVQKDASGNTLLSQTVHNQLTNDGENFLLNQAFASTTASVADTLRIGAICVTGVVAPLGETSTAATMSAVPLGTSLDNCKVHTLAAASTNSLAVIGPLTFIGGTEVPAAGEIQSIAICNHAAADYALCSDASGVAFAIVNTNPVTLEQDDTVEITYTFNVESPDT